MAAAVTWLVIWFVVGVIGTWGVGLGTFVAFAYGVTEEKWSGIGLGVLFGILGTCWTILWVVQFILQIVSIVNILTGASA